MRSTAIDATFLLITTANLASEAASYLADRPGARAERPIEMTWRTSAALKRELLASMLYRKACAAAAGAALEHLAACRSGIALEKSVRTGSFALFWLVCN